VKKPPTTENTTHDPDDAPAEREIIGSHMLEAVRIYESTGRLLISLATTATEHAHRNPDDKHAANVAEILTAIEIAHREGDSESQALIKKLAGKVDHYMRREPLHGEHSEFKGPVRAVSHAT